MRQLFEAAVSWSYDSPAKGGLHHGLFSFQRSVKGFVENVPSPIIFFRAFLQGVFRISQKYFLIFLIAVVMLREAA